MKYRSIENMVSFMENIASDDAHGYSQVKRYGPDFDCSSLVSFALIYGGFNVIYSSTTWDLLKQLINNGWTTIDTKASRKRGDIFLNPDHHVIVCTDDKNIVHASGTKKGILKEPFYIPSFGYNYHLRYTDNVMKKSVHEIALEVIKGKWGNYPERKRLLENAGYDYNEVQNEVNKILKGGS